MLDCCNLSLISLKAQGAGYTNSKNPSFRCFFFLFKMNIFLMLISLFMCN